MARSFGGTAADKFDINVTPIAASATAYTVSCWVNPGVFSGIRNIYNFAKTDGYCSQLRRNSANWEFYHYSAGDKLAGETSGVTNGSWVHLGCVWSGTNIYLYRNGILRGGPTAASAFSRTGTYNALGYQRYQTPSQFWGGLIGEVAVWNVALTVNELLGLANGARPYMIRHAAITAYWPVDGLSSPEPDLSGNANNGTLTGTAYANGPPVTMFTPRWPINDLFPSAGPSFIPAWASQSNLPILGGGVY